jgi:hypothetical protein
MAVVTKHNLSPLRDHPADTPRSFMPLDAELLQENFLLTVPCIRPCAVTN